MTLSKENGDYLVKIAKEAIETYLKNKTKIKPPIDCPKELKEDLGIFVTLNKNNELRGCIGYPEPIVPGIVAVINVGIAAACEDPRFPPITLEEFKKVNIEVTALTKPQLIIVEKPIEYLNKIKIGEDGLIIENGFNKGLLLPQVATENNMDVEEFLYHTCLKAGLNPDSWLDNNTKIYKFQGQIFF